MVMMIIILDHLTGVVKWNWGVARLRRSSRVHPVEHARRLLREVPLIRAWCESVVHAVAYRPGSVIRVIPDGSVMSDPTLQAVLALEANDAYQYARRFLRYVEQADPKALDDLMRGAVTGEAARLAQEVAELFPESPLDRVD